MTNENIIEAAKEHEKGTDFCDLVLNQKSKGVNSAYGIGFIEGAVWAREQIIDKACEWIKQNVAGWTLKFIEDFKEAMEAEE